jgi:exosortase
MTLAAVSSKDEPTKGRSMTARDARGRTVWFALLVGLTLAAFWAPLNALVRLAFQDEQYSHILLIPPVSAALLILERRRIFSHVETRWGIGLGLLFAGAVFYWVGLRHAASASQNDRLGITIFSMVVVWVGGFVLCYGTSALRTGLFSVLFLFLIVPIPDFVLDKVISWLLAGSAEVTYALFELVGVPVLRIGPIFSLPGITIEIAKECSGIRSSLVMLITSLLAGHLYLQSAWTKTLLSLVTLPLVIVKNGIRIVTLTLLAVYVDPSFLAGDLHRRGGVVFFLLALVILAPVLWLLQRSERMAKSRTP